MTKQPKRPRDLNEWAKRMVDLATGTAAEPTAPQKNEAAAALGRLGGLKGGKARAAALSPQKRKNIAKKAAKKRWGNQKVRRGIDG